MATVTQLDAHTLGGSEIAAACGIGAESAISLAARKLGLIPEPERTEAMRLGVLLEQHVAAYAVEQGYAFEPVRPKPLYDYNPKWARGTPDGYSTVHGEIAVAEIKVTNGYGWPSHGVPVHYQAQGQWYLMLTGAPFVRFFVLLAGTRFAVYDYERDDDAIAALVAGGDAFLRIVRRGKLPAPDGSQSAHAAVRQLYPDAEPGKAIRADREAWRLVREARARKQQRDEIGRQYAELQQRLEAYMGDAETLISPHDEEIARFTSFESRRMDTKALREALPHVADEYTTTTTSRRFSLK